MSGTKHCSIRLREDVRRAQELQQQVRTALLTRQALHVALSSLVEEMTGEQQAREFLQQARQWLEAPATRPAADQNADQLQRLRDQVRSACAQGQELQKSLLSVREREAQVRELLVEFHACQTTFGGCETEGQHWRTADTTQTRRHLEECRQRITERQLDSARSQLDSVRREIETLSTTCRELQLQDDQRRYVLTKLREVCVRLGWLENGEPALENSHDPTSVLLYEVDTFTQGTMTFRLSLADIKVESPLRAEENYCLEQFDRISDALQASGVETRFEPVSGPGPRPPDVERKQTPQSSPRQREGGRS